MVVVFVSAVFVVAFVVTIIIIKVSIIICPSLDKDEMGLGGGAEGDTQTDKHM